MGGAVDEKREQGEGKKDLDAAKRGERQVKREESRGGVGGEGKAVETAEKVGESGEKRAK